jgi:hypothetical protein
MSVHSDYHFRAAGIMGGEMIVTLAEPVKAPQSLQLSWRWHRETCGCDKWLPSQSPSYLWVVWHAEYPKTPPPPGAPGVEPEEEEQEEEEEVVVVVVGHEMKVATL